MSGADAAPSRHNTPRRKPGGEHAFSNAEAGGARTERGCRSQAWYTSAAHARTMASNNAVHPSPTPKEKEEVLDLSSEDEDAAKERQIEITPYEVPTTFKPVCHEVDEEGKTVEDSVDLPPAPNENDHHPLLDEKNRKVVDFDLGLPHWEVFAQFMKYGAEGCQRGLPFIMLLTEQHRPLKTRGFPCLTTTVTYDGRCAAGAYQQHDAGRGRV
jgi:hypothetical protein